MEYLFAALIVFSSLFIGRILAKYTKEEITAGKKYFSLLEKILLIVCIFLFFGAILYLLTLSSFSQVIFGVIGFLLGILVSITFFGLSGLFSVILRVLR